MQSFLQDVVDALDTPIEELAKFTFVLPNKRAGAHLRNILGSRSEKPFIAPRILSIEDFVQELSDLQLVSNTELLFYAYRVYRELPIDQHDDLDTFSGWITPLLSDFNEIDRYCLPAKEVFLNLGRIKALERWEIHEPTSELMESHLQFWEQLPLLYDKLNEELLDQGLGYQGAIYRKASEDIEHYINAGRMQGSMHLFVGFNALNTAEQLILQELLRQGQGKVFWDMDSYFMERPTDPVAMFISGFIDQWPYYRSHRPDFIHGHYRTDKEIELIEVQKQMGQVHYTAQLLAGLNAEELAKTAVILADEKLLTPLLHALPENVSKVNITMGTPLRSAPAASFFDQLLLLKSRNGKTMHHAGVSSLLQHPLTRLIIHDSQSIIRQMNTANLSYPTAADLTELSSNRDQDIVGLLFDPWTSVDQAIAGCLNLIELWRKQPQLDPVVTASLHKLFGILQQIGTLQDTFGHLKKLGTLHTLFQDLVRNEQLDLEGEPLAGLQIMGLLETRTLDFERVIMLSVNEGTLPAGRQGSTYLPTDIKRAFELPTFEEKDAIFAYHFFRTLFRAKQVHLMFNAHSEGITTGELSRFIRMLRLQRIPAHRIQETRINPALEIGSKKPLTVVKNDRVMKKIAERALKGFSPSALTGYVRNPIDFYLRYVLGIRESDEMEETVAYNTLGTIVHDSLELLYQPFVGKSLTIEGLDDMRTQSRAVVTEQFVAHFKRGEVDKGMNRIIFEVACRYVEKMIALDHTVLQNGHRIEIVSLEEELSTTLEVPHLPDPIKIRGFADRIDRLDGALRIIDYKTGKVEPKHLKLEEWTELNEDEKKGKAFQVLTYALLLKASYPEESYQAGIISFKNFKAGFIPFTHEKQAIIDWPILDAFTEQLMALVTAICDPGIPFTEKEIPTYDYL